MDDTGVLKKQLPNPILRGPESRVQFKVVNRSAGGVFSG